MSNGLFTMAHLRIKDGGGILPVVERALAERLPIFVTIFTPNKITC